MIPFLPTSSRWHDITKSDYQITKYPHQIKAGGWWGPVPNLRGGWWGQVCPEGANPGSKGIFKVPDQESHSGCYQLTLDPLLANVRQASAVQLAVRSPVDPVNCSQPSSQLCSRLAAKLSVYRCRHPMTAVTNYCKQYITSWGIETPPSTSLQAYFEAHGRSTTDRNHCNCTIPYPLDAIQRAVQCGVASS